MGCSVPPPPPPPRQGGGGGSSPRKTERILPPPTPPKPHPAHRASSHAVGGLKSRGCGVEGGQHPIDELQLAGSRGVCVCVFVRVFICVCVRATEILCMKYVK